jgi:hypothetical protein
MTGRAVAASPQKYARIGGILYLFICIVAAFVEVFVRGQLIVKGDATATAANILASETLFRVGLAGEMLTCACDVALAMILYALLKPVSRNLALLGAFFRLAFVALYSVTKLFEIAALVALSPADYLTAFEPRQLHALAYMSLRVHSLGYGASFLFFGLCCLLFGYLIYKSEYLPRILGVLLELGGLGYIAFSLAQMLAPDFASRVLFPWIMAPALPGELGLSLWLIVKGVDVRKWEERAS